MTAIPTDLTSAQLLAQQSKRTAGLAFLQAIKDGELPPPPIAELLGFRIEALEPGEVTFALDPREMHYNPIGVVHGRVAATLLDTVMGCALHTLLPQGTGYTTLDVTVRFVRPVTIDTGTVLATGTVLHRGRRAAAAQARLVAAAGGQLRAHGTASRRVLS
jgi:uncharacterized protein (TIGR00369 family)